MTTRRVEEVEDLFAQLMLYDVESSCWGSMARDDKRVSISINLGDDLFRKESSPKFHGITALQYELYDVRGV